MITRLKLNHANLRRILVVDAAPHTQRIADRIASSASSLAGTPDGTSITVKRDDGTTGRRARSAVSVTHRTAAGRRAAREAALSAMRVAG